jgi:hypothetical protein
VSSSLDLVRGTVAGVVVGAEKSRRVSLASGGTRPLMLAPVVACLIFFSRIVPILDSLFRLCRNWGSAGSRSLGPSICQTM